MFGARAENPSRASHFANAARRFALDAKMFRCRAAVHVENKDDIAFWGAVLKHFRPDDKVSLHFRFTERIWTGDLWSYPMFEIF